MAECNLKRISSFVSSNCKKSIMVDFNLFVLSHAKYDWFENLKFHEAPPNQQINQTWNERFTSKSWNRKHWFQLEITNTTWVCMD